MLTNTIRPWLLGAALLTGCIPDPPQPDKHTATLSGIVEIDGPVANATVYVDFDNNNLLGFEPKVETDASGHFTVSWDNDRPFYATTIAVIAPATPARNFTLHMRAPLGDTSGDYNGTAVISPLTTLVVAEMEGDPSLTQATASAKIATALTASTLPFTGQPDVMADYGTDYKAGTPTSANSVQLCYIANAVAPIIAGTVAKVNSEQSWIDANDATYFSPAIVALDQQLTTIANGTHALVEMTAAERADVQQNPGNHPGLFVESSTLEQDIEAALIDMALDLAAELFSEFADEFIKSMTAAATEMAADLLVEVIEKIATAVL